MQIIALAIFGFIFSVVFIIVHLVFKRHHWLLKGIISFIGTIGVICLTIYIFAPKSIDYSDPELAPLWKAVETVDRASMGFTPVSRDSKISIERASSKEYDVMLHICHRTSRTIAFRKENDNYYWIGEQESFDGPNQYSTPDGTFHESITLTYGGFNSQVQLSRVLLI